MSQGSSPAVYPSSSLTHIYPLEFYSSLRKKNPICWKEIFVANMTTVESLLHNSCESKHQWLKWTTMSLGTEAPKETESNSFIPRHCVHIIHRQHSRPCSHLCYSCSSQCFTKLKKKKKFKIPLFSKTGDSESCQSLTRSSDYTDRFWHLCLILNANMSIYSLAWVLLSQNLFGGV